MFSPTFSSATTGAAWRMTPPAAREAKRQRLELAGLLAVLLFYCDHAAAQLMVYPTRVVLENNQRSEQLEIVNNSGRSVTYLISLVNRRMDEDGKFSAVETPLPGEQFADAMLRYSPRRVTLAPGANQVIRVMARRPAELAAGEYRSHLLFAEQPDAQAPANTQPKEDSSAGIGVSLTALVGVTVPVILRAGATAASVSLGNLSISGATASQPPVVAVDLQRSGNRSTYGDLSASFAAAGRAPLEIGKVAGLAVYTPNALRRVKLQLNAPAGMALSNGTLTVRYQERTGRSNEPSVETSIALP